MEIIPKKVFFTSGIGTHKDALVSFELALRSAGIEKLNLVAVSSILPPHCEIVDNEKLGFSPGAISFCVMGRMTSGEDGKTIYASVGIAIPEDPTLNGYLTEYHGFCQPDENVGRYAEEMAAYLFETGLNVKVGRKFNVTKKALVEEGKHTTVIAVAVFGQVYGEKAHYF